MTKDTGGYAFSAHDSMGACIANGMTLRDWFAGQALVGILAGSTAMPKNVPNKEVERIIAGGAFNVADAMIAERNKP